MNGGILKSLALTLVLLTASVSLSACGYSREEKQRMEEIEARGRENAAAYVEEKYGFIPTVLQVQACTEREDGDPFPWANGYVLAYMSDGEEEFQVHIDGQTVTLEGADNYQYDLIMEEAREYFKAFAGYEIYDIYMEYGTNTEIRDSVPGCHEDYFLTELYEFGNFEDFLSRHPVNLRIDDCTNQDFTDRKEENAGGFTFFEKCAESYGMNAVLISYRSVEDYEKGYSHTYGRGGLLDFDIEKDGMYICSYAAFEKEKTAVCRFQLQECEGMLFCCIDKAEGKDLQISAGGDVWLDLGETRGEPLSKVYSVDKNEPGIIVVYIPVELFGRNVSVFIQHFYEGKWWQYEDNTRLTTDKQYIVATSVGFPDSSFDFAVFK